MVIYFTVYRRSSIFDSHPLLLGGGHKAHTITTHCLTAPYSGAIEPPNRSPIARGTKSFTVAI